MTARAIAVATLVAFVAFNCSCYSVKMEPGAALAESRGRGAKILAVLTKGGETIEFDEQHPGWIHDGRIVGFITRPVDVTLAKSRVFKSLRSTGGRITSIWTKEWKRYAVNRVTADTADSLSFVAVERVLVTVPLADVDTVSVRRVDTAETVAATVIVAAISWAVVRALAAASWDPIVPFGGD